MTYVRTSCEPWRAALMLASAVAIVTTTSSAHAQTEPAPATAPPATDETPAAPPPAAPAAEAPAADAPVEAPVAAEVTPAEPVAAVEAEEDPTTKPLSARAWGRIANVVQGSDPKKLNDISQSVEVDLLLGGHIHKRVAWQADFVATYGPKPEMDGTGMPTGKVSGDITGNASILDLIGQFEIAESANVWIGRMLVPSDRSNFSGAWFMAPWSYPGFYRAFAPPAGPRQGPFGRNDGATVWGALAGGRFKYYAGAYDLFDPSQSPLFSARLNLALLSPEPGYYHSSAYYGKDILAIGVNAQYKQDGSAAADPLMPVDDYAGFSVDVLYEKKLGEAVLDLEGAFYLFTGDNEALDNHFYALAAYVLPQTLGIGKLQPLIRFQGATPADGSDMWRIVELQAGYIIKPYAARIALLYQRTDVGDAASNAIIAGVQLQK